MDNLSSQRCLPCEGSQPALDHNQVRELIQQLPNWSLTEDQNAISRRFTFKGFQKTIAFINALAWIVNQQNHHPTLEVGYDYCIVTFTTHALKGLSKNDFICASKIDALLM